MEYLLQPKAGLAAAAAKANTQEAGAGVKEGGLFVDAAHSCLKSTSQLKQRFL